MYQKPSLTKLGSFREVTRGGPRSWAIDFSADNWRELFFHETPTTS